MPLTDPFLFQCPFVMMTDVGELSLDARGSRALRQYLDKGGFLWVDDFWGSWSWDAFEQRDRRRPAAGTVSDSRSDARASDLPDALRSRAAAADSVDQFLARHGRRHLGAGADSAEPHIRAITDRHGRMLVLITHNTDISDAWEREAADPRYFLEFSPQGYAVGLNVVLYAMTH